VQRRAGGQVRGSPKKPRASAWSGCAAGRRPTGEKDDHPELVTVLNGQHKGLELDSLVFALHWIQLVN
jgi:hypothetical protein